MMNQQKILCIGHATHDTFLSVEDAHLYCNINDSTTQVCFEFGSKIPVKDVHYSTGGGAANVAVGLNKAGIEVSIFAIVGKDQKGQEVFKQLSEKGIDTTHVKEDDIATDQASIISYAGERTLFTYNHPRDYSVDGILDEFSNVFLSSVGERVSNLYDELIQWRKKDQNFKLFYNPGSKELRLANEDVEKISTHIDYLIANIEEGCTVLNKTLKRHQIEEHDLVNLLVRKGVKNVVLTDAANGVYVGSENDIFHLPIIESVVVEKTGAGDAFASGFISGILNGEDLRRAAQWGLINSASAIQVVGAQSGLLTKEQIQERIV